MKGTELSTLRRKYATWVVAAGLVLGGSILAAATAHAQAGPAVYSAEAAGYQAASTPGDRAPWHFRYVQAQLVLPDVTSNTGKAAFPGGYGDSVRLTNAGSAAVLGISTTPASGVYNPAFNFEKATTGATIGTGGCLNTNSPAIQAGDTVVLSLYFSGSVIGYNVTDKTSPAGDFSGSCTDPAAGDLFTSAQIGAEFGVTPWSVAAPARVNGNHRLVTFTSTVVTSRTGIRGSAGSAPWVTQPVTLTAGGNDVRASVPFTWGQYKAAPDLVNRPGRNFSVWLPAAPS